VAVRSFGSPIVSLEVNDGDVEDLERDSCRMESSTKDSTTNCNRWEGKAPLREQLNDGMSKSKREFPFELHDDKKSTSLLGPSIQNCTKINKNEDHDVECIEIDLSDSSFDDGISDMKLVVSDKGGEEIKPVIKKTASQHPLPNNDKSDYSDADYLDFDGEFRINKKPSAASKEDPSSWKRNSPKKQKSYDSSDDNSSHSTKLQRGEDQPTAMTKVHNPYGQAQTSTAEKNSCYMDNSNLSHSSDSTISLPMEMLSSAMKECKKLRLKQKEGKFAGLASGKGRVSFNNSDDIEVFGDDQGPEDAADFSFGTYGGFDEDDDQKDSTESRPRKKERVKATPKTKPKLKTSLHDDIEVLDDGSDSSSSKSSAELFTPRPFEKNATKPAMQNQCPNSSFSSSKLSTPCAFSPAATSPTLGAYAKRKVPTPAIPAMSASLVKELGGKMYPDLRHNFLVALASHARRSRNNSYQRATFDSSLRSIVVIG
jgi:hypothetical protein